MVFFFFFFVALQKQSNYGSFKNVENQDYSKTKFSDASSKWRSISCVEMLKTASLFFEIFVGMGICCTESGNSLGLIHRKFYNFGDSSPWCSCEFFGRTALYVSLTDLYLSTVLTVLLASHFTLLNTYQAIPWSNDSEACENILLDASISFISEL